MKYVYPKLSSKDLFFIRFGGAGLGNLLFAYGRALDYAKKNGCRVIWPTWPSLKIGPYLRREKDKRHYIGLFCNRSGAIGGLKKMWLLLTHKKVDESIADQCPENGIVVFEKFIGSFKPIREAHVQMREALYTNLRDKTVLQFDATGAVLLHVRLGDFGKVTEAELKAGKHDSRLPITWYCEMLKQIRDICGTTVPAYVFSDGTDEELSSLLSMENVQRKTFGNAIADIIALSKAPLFIASGSSFSMWARYLGRQNTICYTNQIKEKILTQGDTAFEIEVEDTIPNELKSRIQECLQGE